MSPFWLASLRKRFHGSSRGLRRRAPRTTQLRLDTLEDRTVPATLTESGTTLTITMDQTDEALAVVSNGTTYGLTSNFNFVDGGITAGRVTGFGSKSAIVTAAGLAAYDTINITDSAQNTRVTFNNSGTNAYSDNFTITLDDDTSVASGDARSVDFAGSSSFGANNLSVTSTRDIYVRPTANVSTTSGNINFSANTAGTTTGTFDGVTVQSTGKVTTTTGNITMSGTGGTIGTGAGVLLLNVQVGSTTGVISLTGKGSATDGEGIRIQGETNSPSAVTSQGGAITLAGTAPGTGGRSVGVKITGASSVENTGSGSITFTGQGAKGGISVVESARVQAALGSIAMIGTSSGGSGIDIADATVTTSATVAGQGNITLNGAGLNGVGLTDSSLSTVAGNIAVTGNASNSNGISVFGDTTITTTGTGTNAGNITLTGKAGTSSTALPGGVAIGNFTSRAIEISTIDGNIAVAGESSKGRGITFAIGVIQSTGSGDVSLTGTATTATGRDGVSVSADVLTNSGNLTITGTSETNVGVRTAGSGKRVGTTSGSVTITGTSTSSDGVAISSEVSAANAAAIDITGTTTSATKAGVVLSGSAGKVVTATGPINITATGAGGVSLKAPVSLSGGAVTIVSDFDITGDAKGKLTNTSGDITLTADADGKGVVGDAGTIQLAGDITVGTGKLALSLTDTDGFLNGNIVSASQVVKSGTGTLAMNGTANAYTGTTQVNAGTLLVNGAITGTGAVTVATGGTLGGTGSIGGVVTVNTGGIITGGTIGDAGTLTVGGLTFNGGKYTADLQGNTSDTIATAGAVNLNAGTAGIFNLNVLGGGTSKGVTYTLIDNQGAGAIIDPPLTNATEGGTVMVNGQTGTYTYLGGTGNDFTLAVSAGPVATFTGTAADENFRLVLNGANIELYSVATIVVGPTGAITVTGQSAMPLQTFVAAGVDLFVLDGNGGSDNLLIDYTGTAGLEDIDVSFIGGGAATNSGLFVNGGTFGKIEYAPVDANDGFFGNFDAPGTSLRSIIFYDGLAPIVNNSTVTDIVFDLPASGNIQAILEDDGTTGNTLSRFRSNPAAFEQTDFRNPTGSLTINRGSATDDLTINALPDFNAGVTLGSGLTPFDKMTVAGAVTLAAGKNLTVNAATITFSTASSDVALSGAGTAALTAGRSIAMAAGSSLTTVGGDVTLSGNAAGTAAGNFDGIQIAGGTVQSKGSGIVTLTGVAGTGFTDGAGVEVSAGGVVASGTGTVMVTGTGGAGPGANEIGVSVTGGSKITSGGDVLVEGTGGAGTGDGNHGVLVTGAGSAIGSTAGTVTVTGAGGGTGASKSNVGVFVDAGGAIQASGTGAVEVLGFGGLTTGNSNSGVVVQTGGSITSVDGDLSVGGLAGGTGAASSGFGVFVNATSAAATTIAATGAGNVNVAGIGSDGTGTDNSGVVVSGAAASIASGKGGGDVSVSAAAGEGSNQFGVSLRNGGAVTAVGGNVLIDGVASLTGVGGNVQLNGPVTTAGGAVDIGADNDITGDASGDISTGGGDIMLTADQDAFGAVGSAGTLQLAGDLTAGTGFISLALADADGFLNGNIVSADLLEKDGLGILQMNGAANAYSGETVVNEGTLLVDGAITGTGDVSVFSGATLGGTGSIAGEVFVGGTITGGTATTVGTLTVGGLSFDGGTYDADLQGNTSDKIATAGTVDLQATAQGIFSLNVLGGPTSPGTTFTLIDNTGAGAIANPPLANAAEGGTTTVNGLIGTFTYLGGTGNDFTMSVVAPARPQVFAVGGANGTVRLYQPDGTLISTLTPITGYTGLVSVALGDFDGDGTPDLAVAAASPLGVAGLTSNKAGKVFVFDGVDAAAGKLTLDHTFTPFATHSGPSGNTGAYTNGLNIATGDIDGDGNIDLIAGTRGQEGGPNGQPIGQAEFGRLAVVNQGTAANGSQDTLIGTILTPFGSGYQKGVVVATGNLNGLGGDEIGATRGGPVAQNLAPRIQSLKLKAFQFAGGALLELDLSGGGFNPDGSTTQPLAPFAGLPGGRIIRDGRIAFTDQNGDGKSELVFSAIDPFTTPGSNTIRISAFDVNTATGKATAVSTGTGPSKSYTHGSGVSVSFDTTAVAANAGVDNLAIVTTPNGSTAGTVAYLDPLSGNTLAGGYSLSVAIGGVTFDGS